MDKETRPDINSLEYWKKKPVEIAEKLGYMLNEEFFKALIGFNQMLGEEEERQRKNTKGKRGIVSNHLGAVAERYFRESEPPLEKEKKKKRKKQKKYKD